MNGSVLIDFDPDWFDEDEDEDLEPMGELFIRNPVTGLFFQIDAAHLPHFMALYEREDDLLN